MKKSIKFFAEVRERAVRLAQEHRGEYPSLWAAVEAIASKIGCVPQTLLELVKRQEIGLCHQRHGRSGGWSGNRRGGEKGCRRGRRRGNSAV